MSNDIEPYHQRGDGEAPLESEKKEDITDVTVHHANHSDTDSLDGGHDRGTNAGRPHNIEATGSDLADAEEKAKNMSLEECKKIMTTVRKLHHHDQNFPAETMLSICELLDNPGVTEHPKDHADLIYAMKLEAILITENSPYAEVRAVVSPNDDPTLPSLTFRVWLIGVIFAGIGAFVNMLFEPRLPAISVTTPVGQLLAYPCGKFLERILPTREFSLFGRRFSFNPGPFNKKEHMLITVMCTLGFSVPYTADIVFIQALPIFYNQPYAFNYGYQIINTLGLTFLGYGMAGLTRKFIVYPSHCIWPDKLPVLALNTSFHQPDGGPIAGPFKRMYSWTRYQFFMAAFIAMFVYFWFPNFIFGALSTFSWMTWIAPENVNLNAICGCRVGLCFNPISTFDWNNFGGGALTTPIFSQVNQLIGMLVFGFILIAFWYSNAFNTGYLPINSNRTFDNRGKLFNVTKILNHKGELDYDKYQQYSEPWMAAGNLALYFAFFAAYAATITYMFLYHRHDLARAFRLAYYGVRNLFRRKGSDVDPETEMELGEDRHFKLMKAYKEVPEWWYLIVFLVAFVFGIVGVACYPTNTSPAVVVFGVIIALIFTIPTGIIGSITGVRVTMNVLAEFIGGALVPGNAISMAYFKAYGVQTASSALNFAGDLKLAHYTKIPPRHVFVCQLVATFISCFVCAAVFNFDLGFKDVCTNKAGWKMTCPNENTFFTAAVFWGTLSPKRIFGLKGHFRTLLVGFPLGFLIAIASYLLRKWFPKSKIIRGIHPVVFCFGGVQWAPYNFMYNWPTFVVTWFSFNVIRPRYLAFWSKYNYIIPAAFNCGVALAGIVMFFALSIPEKDIDWWGNNVVYFGCEGTSGCPRLKIPEKGYFGADPGNFI